jgi:ABC-type amino acid transport substrate-binding protein
MIKSLFLTICLFSSGVCQKDIYIYRTIPHISISHIEESILKNAVLLFNKSNPLNELKINYKMYDNFGIMIKDFKLACKDDITSSIMVADILNITEDRKNNFTFSEKYLPSQEIFYKRGSDKTPFSLIKDKNIAYMTNSVTESSVAYYKEKTNANFIGVNSTIDILNGVKSKKYDYGIDEYITIWEEPLLQCAKEIGRNIRLGYGFMYSKDSILKDQLDKYIIYYIKSAKFHKLLEKKYSVEIKNYFVKSMFKPKKLEFENL